jgi:hypothetical protein
MNKFSLSQILLPYVLWSTIIAAPKLTPASLNTYDSKIFKTYFYTHIIAQVHNHPVLQKEG